jgi:SnoaL-like domain
MDPEVKFEHRMAELQGDFTGVDAVRDWFADLAQHFDRWRIDCDDFRDLGDRVLALGTLRAVGKGSGVEAEVPYTVVARFRNGRPPGCRSSAKTTIASGYRSLAQCSNSRSEGLAGLATSAQRLASIYSGNRKRLNPACGACTITSPDPKSRTLSWSWPSAFSLGSP